MRLRLVYEFEKEYDVGDKFKLTKLELKRLEDELLGKLWDEHITLDMLEERD